MTTTTNHDKIGDHIR